jgi:hypothetical protein
MLLAAAGCGDSGAEPNTPTTPLPPDPPAPPITAAGGTVTSDDGKVSLVIPAGALSAPTTITITPATVSHARLLPGTAYTFAPDGLQFAVPARLTIRYDSIPAALANDAAFVWLHRRNGSDWDPMEGEPVDTVNRVIAGQINGFSQYGGATSSLAADVLYVGLQLNAMLTQAVAQNAVNLTKSLSDLFMRQADPAFVPLVDPFLQAAYATACTAYSTALGIARDAPITDYGKFTELMAPSLYWASVIQELGPKVPCAASVDLLLTEMQDRKFQQFSDFYLARLSPASIGSNFDDLVAEVQFVLAFRTQLHALGLDAIDARIEAEAQKPLLNAMRASAYNACRDLGDHRYLGGLVGQAVAGDFTASEILDDLQQCGTRVDWQVRSTDGTQNATGTMGGATAPGAWVSEDSGQGVAAGTLTLSGMMRAFKCPAGTYEADELIITLQGTEVHRQAASGSDIFSAPLQLDVETILRAAGVDPYKNAVVPLVVSRASPGCNAYVQSAGPLPLVTLQLQFPAPFGYFANFSNGVGAEWSNPTSTTAPGGEAHLGVINNGSTTLTLGNVPSHTEVVIEFDFYAIQSLDGNETAFGPDIIEFRIDGTPVKRTTFTNVFNPAFTQAFPDDYPSGRHPAGTGATARNSLGYPQNSGQFSDAVYHIRFTRPHTAGTIAFTVAGSNMDQWEGWGLDNVRVTVR